MADGQVISALCFYVDGAYHEAGHAIAYIARGLEFRYVSLRGADAPAGDADGVVLWQPRAISRSDNALIAAAGPAAEIRYREDPAMTVPRITAILNGTDDYYVTEEAGHGDFETFARSADDWAADWRRAEDFVGNQWAAIETVAGELVAAEGYLSYEDVTAIARGARL